MSYKASKRLFDIVCASASLVLLAPVGLLVALLIQLSDRYRFQLSAFRISAFSSR
jgi:lipopolysaccharide/colanic/teichoic acid biosynthesis glycosyltransferase